MFRAGYIHNFGSDLLFFVFLPIIALAAAFYASETLSFVTLASISLWITYPHIAATWVRTFGIQEDRERFSDRLIIGPIVIVSAAILGLKFFPITLIMFITLWDHQHSLMQVHGFSRIYDFKAKTGSPQTGRWDLSLNWVLYLNLFLTTPLFTKFWVRAVYRLGITPSAETVQLIQYCSWGLLTLFLTAYIGRIVLDVKQGYGINPFKYFFLFMSYFFWYVVAWSTNSFLLYMIGHRIIHGIQYILIVYLYLDHKAKDKSIKESLLKQLLSKTNVFGYLAIILIYAAIYQAMTDRPFDEFGFGVFAIMEPYQSIPASAGGGVSEQTAHELFVLLLTNTLVVIHYYYDSFIWKVSDNKTQKGL